MNRQTLKYNFVSAVKDPFRLAQVFQIPPIADTQTAKPVQSQFEVLELNGTDWGPVLTAWLDAWQAAEAGHAVAAYDSQAKLHASFNKLLDQSEGNTLIPALQSICKTTHRMAVAADSTADSSHESLHNAVTLLQESFSRTINDRKEYIPAAPYSDEGSKKAGVLCIVNELFAIYFRLNTLRLCRNLLRPVETRNLHQQGCMSHLVAYHYYTGRLYLMEDQFEAAASSLEFALTNCHKKAVHNKKAILRFFIPVQLFRGRLPSPQLLAKYDLIEFVSIVDSLRKGDLRTFNSALIEYQHRFIRQGTYLLLEKCKKVCYRNLFKRIHFILDSHQIPLSHVHHAFQWLDIPMDLDEIECILANLIYQGLIRGYLSHSKRTLVLSKRDPFPISAVIAK